MTRLSNRQFPLLRTFVEEVHSAYHMPITEAQRYDQRPFRSLLIREWIAYHPGRGFKVTQKGREAWAEFQQTEIWRKNPLLPLTAYFDITAYPTRKVVEMKKKVRAA